MHYSKTTILTLNASNEKSNRQQLSSRKNKPILRPHPYPLRLWRGSQTSRCNQKTMTINTNKSCKIAFSIHPLYSSEALGTSPPQGENIKVASLFGEKVADFVAIALATVESRMRSKACC